METTGTVLKNFRCIPALGLALVLACIVLSIVSVSTMTQVRFTVDTEEFTYSILEASSVPNRYNGSSYSCLATLECSSGNDQLCEAGEKLAAARATFLVFWSLSFVCLCLSVPRFLYLALGLYAGSARSFLILAVTLLGLNLAAVVLFVGIAGVNSSCEDGALCADTSFETAVIQTILCGFISVCALLIYRSKLPLAPRHQQGVSRKSVGQIIAACAVGICLQVIGLGVRWLSYSTSAVHRGSLWQMESYDTYDDIEYSCVCLLGQGEDRLCEAMSRAWDAGNLYTKLLVVSTGLLIVWLDHLVHLGRKRPLGNAQTLYGLPWIHLIVYLMALISWFVIAKASTTTECFVDQTDEEILFCNEIGPILGIVAAISFCISGFFTNLLVYQYRQRNYVILPEDSFTSQESPKKSNQKLEKRFGFSERVHPRLENSIDLHEKKHPILGEGIDIHQKRHPILRDSIDARREGLPRLKNSVDLRQRSYPMPEDSFDLERSHLDQTISTTLQQVPHGDCRTCMRAYDSTTIQIAECGHILHKWCKLRIDGNLLCALCYKPRDRR